MENKIRELCIYRLEKASADLESAEILFKNELYAQSVNRSYYSIFHCARALLSFNKFDSKKHSGIIAFFNKNYVKNNLLPQSASRIIMHAEKIRINSDYDDFFVVNKKAAENQIKDAKNFFYDILSYIEKTYSIKFQKKI